MTSDAANLTKTERNLWNAVVSEAMAYLKYNAYAHRALEEGHPEVAQVFQEVAGAETIHGMNHLRVAGEVATTLDNLREVAVAESKEFSYIYPRMIREALDEGRPDAADSFALALEREHHHLEAFTRALAQLEAKQSNIATAVTPPAPKPEAPPIAAPAATVEPFSASGVGPPLAGLDTYVAAVHEVDRERFRVANLGRLREVVFGAQDGILSTVALVTSVAVAVGQNSTVLIAGGLAAALAGMLSMATGAYLGSRAEQDVRGPK